MSKFRIGDVCVVISSPYNPHHIGMECTVTSDLRWFWSTDTQDPVLAHAVESSQFEPINEPGLCWFAEPETLRLRRPPSWDKWLYDTSDVKDEREESAPLADGTIYFLADDGEVRVVRP